MNFKTTSGIKFLGSNSWKSNTKIHKLVLHESVSCCGTKHGLR